MKPLQFKKHSALQSNLTVVYCRMAKVKNLERPRQVGAVHWKTAKNPGERWIYFSLH